jgi:TolA-binding protein
MNKDALTSDATTLVAELRSDAALDAITMDRLRERLAVSLTLTQLPNAAAPAAASAAAVVRAGKGLLTSRFGGLALFVLGTAVGAWGHALVGATPERTTQRHAAATRTSASPAIAARPTPAPPTVQAAAPGAPAMTATLAPSSHGHASPRSGSLTSGVENGAAAEISDKGVEGAEGEIRLLDEARQAIANKDGAYALAALRSHADRYPHGALSQERSALLVKALVLEGRFVEARQAGKRFAELYPSSMLLDSVNAALSRIP